MPTYDYVCQACGHHLEHFQSMTSRRLRKCPACGKPKLERRVGSGVGVIFKGSGFYETDYKQSSRSTASTPEGADESKGDVAKTESGTTKKDGETPKKASKEPKQGGESGATDDA